MLKKRKNNVLKINRYNKFLSTLDNEEINPLIKEEEVKDNIKKEKEFIKKEIDNLLDKINYNFDVNKYFSENFTGQTKDFSSNINNPDIYDDFFLSMKNLSK